MTLQKLRLAAPFLLSPALLMAQGRGVGPTELLKPLKDSWPTYNGDYSGKRYSALTQIDRSTVKHLTLAWTIREAVTNVIRHARASRCRIQLTTATGTALLEVVDDGVGPARHPAPIGSGLAGLAERLAAAGGTVDTGPAERRGFRLRARLPMGPPP